MTFTVIYRNQTTGARATEVVEAADRSACFALMKSRGITPQQVVAGGKITTKGTTHSAPPPTWIKGLVAGLLVIICAGGAWWCLRDSFIPKSPSVVEKPVSKTRPVAPKTLPVPAAKPAEIRQETPRTPCAAPIAAPEKNKLPSVGTVLSVETNDNNLVLTRVVGPDGKIRIKTTEATPPVFSNPTDQLLAAVVNASMSGEMPPLPLGPETDLQFKEALKKPIEDLPDDTDAVKAMKQGVREMRQQIVALMEQGQTVAEILTQHQELWNENIKIRNGAQTEYRQILKSGDEEGARKYLNTINIALGQMGIPPIQEGRGRKRRIIKKEKDQ